MKLFVRNRMMTETSNFSLDLSKRMEIFLREHQEEEQEEIEREEGVILRS